MTGYSNSARLRRVFELPVATPLSNLVPAIIMDEAQYISRLHSFCFSVYRSVRGQSGWRSGSLKASHMEAIGTTFRAEAKGDWGWGGLKVTMPSFEIGYAKEGVEVTGRGDSFSYRL